MPYHLMEANAKQTINGGKCAFYPWANDWRECREEQCNQDGNERAQYDYQSDPCHPDPVNNLVDPKLFVCKGRNLIRHLGGKTLSSRALALRIPPLQDVHLSQSSNAPF